MNAVRRSLIAAMTLALMAAAGTPAARAAPPPSPPALTPPSPPRAAPALTMDQAVKLAERRYRARVVRAETLTQGDRTIYVLRMLDAAGRVFSVRVDAVSGTARESTNASTGGGR
jgi:hypothetical protein